LNELGKDEIAKTKSKKRKKFQSKQKRSEVNLAVKNAAIERCKKKK
jgi:hypothetical protein